MTKQLSTLLIVSALIAIVLISGIYFYFKNRTNLASISDFDSCLASGFPIMESYPRLCKTSDNRTFKEYIGNGIEKANLIRVNFPKPNELIKSPLVITGEARGSWFFEASFPVRIADSNGDTLVSGVAQAQGNWMTTDFVPFKLEFKFAPAPTKKGAIIFSKDNPSGLPEHDDELVVPIEF